MPPKKITMKSGDGVFDEIKLPNLPNKVQQLYKKLKEKKIDKMVVFRRPVGDAIEGALNAFTGNSVDKFFKQTPYDTLFHLGIIINDKYLFHKQENFTLENIPGGYKKFIKGKDLELDPVSDFGDITIKDLFRKTRDKMGDKKFYGYDAFKNNCQDFVVKALEAVGAKFDKSFVKQDLKKLSKKIPSFTKKIGNFFTDFARTARQLIGFGNGSSNEGGAEEKEEEKKKPPPKKKDARTSTPQERLQKKRDDEDDESKRDDEDKPNRPPLSIVPTKSGNGYNTIVGRSVVIMK